MMKYDIESQQATPDLMNKKNQHYQILLQLKNIVEHLHSDQEVSINDQQILELVAMIVKVLNHGLDFLLSTPSMQQGFYGHLHNQINQRKSTKFIQKCLKFLKSDRLKAPIWVLLELNANTITDFIQSSDVQSRYQNNACIRQGELLDILDSYFSKHIKLVGDKIFDPPTPLVREPSMKSFFPLPPNISNNMQGDIFERFNLFEDIQPIKHVTSLDCDDTDTHAPTHRRQEMETPEIRFGSDYEEDHVLDDDTEPEEKRSELQYLSFQCKKSTKLLRDLREKQVEEYWSPLPPQKIFQGQCQSCSIPIQKRKLLFFQGTAHLCNFSGYYFCDKCMSDKHSEIPHEILINFDFTKMPVSREAYDEIEKKFNMKKFQINYFDNIVYENQQLYDFLVIKRSLRLMYDLLCQDYCFRYDFVKDYQHLLLPINIFSLQDLVDIKDGKLIKILQDAYNFGLQHIKECPLCQKLQVKCAECQKGVIFIFDIVNTQYCRKCKKLFHRQCFYEKCSKCGQTQKIDSKRLMKQ